MKKNIFTLAILIMLPYVICAQQWNVRQSLGSTQKRTFATSFAINGKIYVVGGEFNFIGLKDVWEYTIATDSWAQKADFPGGTRGGAVAFSIGGKGYFTGGADYIGHFFHDVWEYAPATDTWTQKANFPGGDREEAVGFTIGNKGYLGTGYVEIYSPNSTGFAAYNDFWEYTPGSDTWIQKANVPGPTRGWAIGATAGGLGYIGLGGNDGQNQSFSDFYEYDPATDTWTAKASYPLALSDAMAFSIGNTIYVCGGISFVSGGISPYLKKFDPALNIWNGAPNMLAGSTVGAVASAEGNSAFVGTGYNGSLIEKDDWWEFSVPANTLCPTPVAFTTSTLATNGTAQCDGKIMIQGIVNGCAPYTFSMSPNTGSVTSGGNSFTISNVCGGTYSLYVTDANCCGTTMSVCTVPGNLVQGIASVERSESLTVFPNPGNGTFSILLSPGSVREHEIIVLNSLGQQVPVTVRASSQGYDIKLNSPPGGIYILHLTVNGKRISKKIQVE